MNYHKHSCHCCGIEINYYGLCYDCNKKLEEDVKQMTLFKDKTYCASPNCKNECGRKMTEEEKEKVEKHKLYVSYAYFCGNDDIKDSCN